ncbi:hypothetical protein KFK09_021992 [Dendrobium nobile]|uniref:Uncharacterized protein n=1 Tax=Dendrobium nobile TaxID=94219 RepID=A0A8T3AHG7_DENNO|nr:hypothetical protein KFK09_021992 [Dendrobium nobile]
MVTRGPSHTRRGHLGLVASKLREAGAFRPASPICLEKTGMPRQVKPPTSAHEKKKKKKEKKKKSSYNSLQR